MNDDSEVCGKLKDWEAGDFLKSYFQRPKRHALTCLKPKAEALARIEDILVEL